MPRVTFTTVTVAIAVFAVACSSTDRVVNGLAESSDASEEAVNGNDPEDAPDSNDDEDVDSDVDVPNGASEQDVADAFAGLVSAADEYDFGNIGFEQLATLLTDDAAERAEGSWEPWLIGDVVSGRREVSGEPHIEFSSSGERATVTDCVWDRRVTTGEDQWGDGNYPTDVLPFGVTHEVTAEFRRTDNGWLAETFRDPFAEEEEWTPCLPSDIEADVLDRAAETQEAIWDAYTIRWAPEFDGEQLESEARESSERLRGAFADSQNEAVMDGRYRVDVQADSGVVGPHSVLVGVCWEQDRWESYDPDTGERISEDNDAQYRSAFWFVRDTTEDDWLLGAVVSSEEAAELGYGVCDDLDRSWDSGNLDRYEQP